MGRKAVIFVVFALCLSGIAALDENNRKPAQKGGSAFYGVHQALKPIGPLLKTMRAIVIAILQVSSSQCPTPCPRAGPWHSAK